MDCKRDCNWNYDGICCSDELDDRYEEATGDDNCPLWLRPDFDKHFEETYDYIKEAITYMNISKLEQIKKFIYTLNLDCEIKDRISKGYHTFGNCDFCKDVNCRYNSSINYNKRGV